MLRVWCPFFSARSHSGNCIQFRHQRHESRYHAIARPKRSQFQFIEETGASESQRTFKNPAEKIVFKTRQSQRDIEAISKNLEGTVFARLQLLQALGRPLGVDRRCCKKTSRRMVAPKKAIGGGAPLASLSTTITILTQ
jgi:hypothetical protein